MNEFSGELPSSDIFQLNKADITDNTPKKQIIDDVLETIKEFFPGAEIVEADDRFIVQIDESQD